MFNETELAPSPHRQPASLRRAGFSLIELMIVVAIISVLASIAIPQYQKFAMKAKLVSALAELSGHKPAIETMLIENGSISGAIDLRNPSSRACADVTLTAEITAHEQRAALYCPLLDDDANRVLEMYRSQGNWFCRGLLVEQGLLSEGCEYFRY